MQFGGFRWGQFSCPKGRLSETYRHRVRLGLASNLVICTTPFRTNEDSHIHWCMMWYIVENALSFIFISIIGNKIIIDNIVLLLVVLVCLVIVCAHNLFVFFIWFFFFVYVCFLLYIVHYICITEYGHQLRWAYIPSGMPAVQLRIIFSLSLKESSVTQSLRRLNKSSLLYTVLIRKISKLSRCGSNVTAF